MEVNILPEFRVTREARCTRDHEVQKAYGILGDRNESARGYKTSAHVRDARRLGLTCSVSTKVPGPYPPSVV